MAVIIPFRAPDSEPSEIEELGLLTAVDVAIRDLADITAHWGSEQAREQAHECRMMLVRAFELARSEG
jgi:hypothetical protein